MSIRSALIIAIPSAKNSISQSFYNLDAFDDYYLHLHLLYSEIHAICLILERLFYKQGSEFLLSKVQRVFSSSIYNEHQLESLRVALNLFFEQYQNKLGYYRILTFNLLVKAQNLKHQLVAVF